MLILDTTTGEQTPTLLCYLWEDRLPASLNTPSPHTRVEAGWWEGRSDGCQEPPREEHGDTWRAPDCHWTSGSRGDVGTHTNLNKTSLEEGCDLGRDWLFSWLTVLFLKKNFF